MFQHHSRQTAVLWNKLSQQRTGLEILRTLVAKCYVYDWNIKHCRTQFMAICVLFILLLGWTLSNKAIWKIVIFLFIIYESIWCIFYFMSSSQSFILVLVQLKHHGFICAYSLPPIFHLWHTFDCAADTLQSQIISALIHIFMYCSLLTITQFSRILETKSSGYAGKWKGRKYDKRHKSKRPRWHTHGGDPLILSHISANVLP